jgi:hypothetical protein
MRGAVFALVLMVTGCGAAQPTAASSARLASPSPSAVATTCPSPSLTSDPTSDWIPLSNVSGQFSLRYPCDWGADNCEASQFGGSPNALLGPEFKGATVNACGHDESIPTLLVVEYPSTAPQGQQPGEYVAPITGTTALTVDSVIGTRQTATVTDVLPLPPQKGATQVVYRFTTGGRTYVVFYTREPGQPDLTGTVDDLVDRTLRFTA